MANTIIALLAILGGIGTVGALYIHLSERLDRQKANQVRLWEQIRYTRKAHMAVCDRLYQLEKHLPGTLAAEHVAYLKEHTINSEPQAKQITDLEQLTASERSWWLSQKQAD